MATNDDSLPTASTAARATPYAKCAIDNIKGCSGCLLDTTHTTCSANTAKSPRWAGTTVGTTGDYVDDVAYWLRTSDLRTGPEVTTGWRQNLPSTQRAYLYPVYLFGTGSPILKDAAIYGGFDDLNENGRPDCGTSIAECYRDSNGYGTITTYDDPITYYEGDDGYNLESSITAAINEILRRAASGTAASVLASGEGSGANLLQSIFYPKRHPLTPSLRSSGPAHF